ncbi:MAG: hypothetical protein H0V09_08060 [Gemmatimonadetes bacterium]|nr:hypothetical protein [Gemmatimonadota bacterium]
MRTLVVAAILALLPLSGTPAQDTEAKSGPAGSRTFKAVLYHVPGTAGSGGAVKVERLKNVLTDPESAEAIGVWVKGGTPEKLQVLTVAPGQENAVVRYKDLTFRISGLYRGPQKERMSLRVSFDEGGQAAVKEFLASLDENVMVTYPMSGEGTGSLVAVLVPVG